MGQEERHGGRGRKGVESVGAREDLQWVGQVMRGAGWCGMEEGEVGLEGCSSVGRGVNEKCGEERCGVGGGGGAGEARAARAWGGGRQSARERNAWGGWEKVLEHHSHQRQAAHLTNLSGYSNMLSSRQFRKRICNMSCSLQLCSHHSLTPFSRYIATVSVGVVMLINIFIAALESVWANGRPASGHQSSASDARGSVQD